MFCGQAIDVSSAAPRVSKKRKENGSDASRFRSHRPAEVKIRTPTANMADSLYFSLWFSDFSAEEMLVRALSVMRQFPFSQGLPGITYFALYPVSWNEPTIFEQRFRPGVSPEEAILIASDLLHDDYAYLFEANWDLWTPQGPEEKWTLLPSPVSIIVRGEEFEEGESKTHGEVQLDFGLDTPFLHEELQLTGEVESRVRANVQMLVDFINRVEKSGMASTRLLWSESGENLAQKLVGRLQRVQ